MLKPFTKFVNFKAHNGLNRPVVVAERTPQMEETQGLIDISQLNWSAETKTQQEQSEAIEDEPGKKRSERWFSSSFSTLKPEQPEEQIDSGKISFHGLTATSETAERLEALLCTTSNNLTTNARHAASSTPGACLNDIFQDMQKDSGSIHRW